MAISIIPGSTAGMDFYPRGYRAAGWRFWRLLAWVATGGPTRDPRRRRNPALIQEANLPVLDPTPGGGGGLLAVYARNDHARRVVAGFAAEIPSLSLLWEQVLRALDDVPSLGAACTRLTAALADTRLNQANLTAAMRAALAADAEGEDDPLSYLRDELAEQQALPVSLGGVHDDA